MTATKPAITLTNLTLAYERHPAVHHVNGSFAEGSLTAIFGPNGAGKSTLIKAMAGLLKPNEGHIDRHHRSARDIAYLPQLIALEDGFPITVLDTVLLGHWRRTGAFAAMTKAMRSAAQDSLAAVGLDGFGHRNFGALSAGQRQRALFARLMVADCQVILLDEPFSAIDAQTTADLMALVLTWHREGRTIVAVLHDPEQVRRHFPEVLLLAREPIAWGATDACLTQENLAKAGAMSAAWGGPAEICGGPQ